MITDDFLNATTDFNLLSLGDLLAAREQFHLHLINKPNVIATAVGRYRIRETDPWPDGQNPTGAPASNRSAKGPRTLANSEVRPYSWPAILAFVDRWVDARDFTHPQDAVPPAVYMPTGQKVPICVIEVATERNTPRRGRQSLIFPLARSAAAIRSSATCRARSILPPSPAW